MSYDPVIPWNQFSCIRCGAQTLCDPDAKIATTPGVHPVRYRCSACAKADGATLAAYFRSMTHRETAR